MAQYLFGQPKVKCSRHILCGTCLEEFQQLKKSQKNYTPIKMEIFMHQLNFGLKLIFQKKINSPKFSFIFFFRKIHRISFCENVPTNILDFIIILKKFIGLYLELPSTLKALLKLAKFLILNTILDSILVCSLEQDIR